MEPLWTRHFVKLTIILFLLFFGYYLLLPTLPIYVKQQGISESHVGLVIGVFTLAAVGIRPLIGVLLDRYGRRIFIIFGLLFFALSMFGYSWIDELFLLLLLRIFHGFSWAVATTSIGTSITDVIPLSRRGEGMGWYGLAMSISMSIGPIMGLKIMNGGTFQNIFFSSASLALAAFLLTWNTKIPFIPQKQQKKFEYFEKNALPVCVAIFFLTITYGGITTYLPLYAESIRVNAGNFFLVYAIALTIIRPLAGKIADQFGERVVIIPSLLMIIAALIVLSYSNGWTGVLITAVLYGIGFGAAQPILQASVLILTPDHKQGVANASFFTAFDLGIGLGAWLLGPVLQYLGYSFLFIICAVSALISLLVFQGNYRRLNKRTHEIGF